MPITAAARRKATTQKLLVGYCSHLVTIYNRGQTRRRHTGLHGQSNMKPQALWKRQLLISNRPVNKFRPPITQVGFHDNMILAFPWHDAVSLRAALWSTHDLRISYVLPPNSRSSRCCWRFIMEMFRLYVLLAVDQLMPYQY